MYVYLIKRNEADWDENEAHFVVARTPRKARVLAAETARQNEDQWHKEPREEWLDCRRSTCTQIGIYTGSRRLPHILYSDFKAG